MGLQNIFSVPIYTTILDNKIIEYLDNLIIPRLNNLTQASEHKTDFFSSKIVSHKELSPFFNYIKKDVNQYSIQSNLYAPPKIDFWIQDYAHHEHHSIHSHLKSNISGIYYVRANESAGELRFLNPNPVFNVVDFREGMKDEAEFYIKPQKGMLVLFPGWLYHEATPSYNKDVLRTCLAFNLVKQVEYEQ